MAGLPAGGAAERRRQTSVEIRLAVCALCRAHGVGLGRRLLCNFDVVRQLTHAILDNARAREGRDQHEQGAHGFNVPRRSACGSPA